MTRAELIELIRNDETSGVEFKRDDVSAAKLASEMVALLNLRGGHILLGVEEDGTVSGLTRDPRKAEEWVMEAARVHIQPATIPYWETVRWDPGKVVGIVSLSEDAPDKRLRDYFEHVLGWGTPGDPEPEAWMTQLINLDLAIRRHRRTAPTVNGVLLFGSNPKRLVPQSGIRAICYAGEEPDYATRADEDLNGPLVPLLDRGGTLLEPGLVDQAWDFVRRNTTPASRLEGLRRVDRWEYPKSVIREAVTNALVHRDYSIAGTDIALTIYSNRLEVTSPGRLPNTVTPEGMRSGMRYARNQTLVNVMRDYGYVDARGMGVRIKIIPGMREHNGTEPDLIEDEYRFTVRLWK